MVTQLNCKRIPLNLMPRNEQFNEDMDKLRKMITDEDYLEARKLCETITSGDLKYRCDSAEFWVLYAQSEKVCS